MAHFNNLPVELISIIAQNLKRTRDLNNFAKVNRKSYEVANPILYRTPAGGSNRGWPLKWAAHQGHVGTLLKALAGGYDPNLELFGPALRPRGDLILRNFGGLKLPSWDPEKEWEPKEGDGEETTHTNPPSHLRIVTNAWDSPNAFDGFGSSDGSDGSDDSELSIGGDWDALEGGDSDESEDPADDLLFGMDYPDYEEFFDDGHAGDGAGEDAYSALHIAAMYGHKDIIHILLEHGAAIDKPTSFLCGCRRAFSHRHLNIFGENELYSAGVWTALHLAIVSVTLDPRGLKTLMGEVRLTVSATVSFSTRNGKVLVIQRRYSCCGALNPRFNGDSSSSCGSIWPYRSCHVSA